MLGALAAGVGLAGYSYAVEPNELRLERLDLPVAGLPVHLDGYRIGVLADLHLGPIVPVKRIIRAATRLAAQQPDLVLVAGDLTAVDDTETSQRLIDAALGAVQGAYAVLGNWDYMHEPLPIGVTPQRTVRFLVNEGVEVAPGLWLAGLDEGIFRDPDLDKALAGAPPGAVRILLAHEPDLADMVRPEHRIALQISGHTHAGQIRLPLLGPLLLPPLGRKYIQGLCQAPACPVYVSRGIGESRVPLRLGSPPEITLITLRRA